MDNKSMLYTVGSYVPLNAKKKEEAPKTRVYVPGTKIIFADLVPSLKVLKITPDLFVFNRAYTA